jgi:hypothetical protein
MTPESLNTLNRSKWPTASTASNKCMWVSLTSSKNCSSINHLTVMHGRIIEEGAKVEWFSDNGAGKKRMSRMWLTFQLIERTALGVKIYELNSWISFTAPELQLPWLKTFFFIFSLSETRKFLLFKYLLVRVKKWHSSTVFSQYFNFFSIVFFFLVIPLACISPHARCVYISHSLLVLASWHISFTKLLTLLWKYLIIQLMFIFIQVVARKC